MPLMNNAPSTSHPFRRMTSTLSPLPEDVTVSTSSTVLSSSSSIDFSHEMALLSPDLYTAMQTIRLSPWVWLKGSKDKKETDSSLSKESEEALSTPVVVVRHANLEELPNLVEKLRAYTRSRNIKTSSRIRMKIARCHDMNSGKSGYKARHSLDNEAGLNFHSGVVLSNLIEECARKVHKSVRMHVDGEKIGNRIDWRLDLSSNEGVRTGVGIEIKPAHNATTQHMANIWNFGKAEEDDEQPMMAVKNGVVRTSPPLEEHAAGLLAQLVGYNDTIRY